MKNKKTYQYSLLFRVFLFLVLIVCIEIAGGILLKRNYGYDKIRTYLMGKKSGDDLPRLTAHPYLNYICTPDYSRMGVQWHNRYGFRGDTVQFEKPADEYRILFLGGSTTYSYFIEDPDSTFPEQVGSMLAELPGREHLLPQEITTIDVINGGLPSGMSSELLSHYLLKFRYYNPDLVVIHAGGNDAFAYYGAGKYQPDYNHFRKTFSEIRPFRKPYHNLFRSRMISYVLIRANFHQFTNSEHYIHSGEDQITDWYHNSNQLSDPDRNAFYNNISTLVRECRAAGSEVLLVPFIYNNEWPGLAEDYMNGISRNIEMMEQISREMQVAYCSITAENIWDKNMWLDDCHLTSSGVEWKARPVVKCISELWRTGVTAELTANQLTEE